MYIMHPVALQVRMRRQDGSFRSSMVTRGYVIVRCMCGCMRRGVYVSYIIVCFRCIIYSNWLIGCHFILFIYLFLAQYAWSVRPLMLIDTAWSAAWRFSKHWRFRIVKWGQDFLINIYCKLAVQSDQPHMQHCGKNRREKKQQQCADMFLIPFSEKH